MSIMQRSSSGYEPTVDKLYNEPLLGFMRTKNTHTEKGARTISTKYS
jgi:RIO kinase 1